MNIHECECYAQEHGHDSVRFTLLGNGRGLPCRWLDAYFGLFVIDDDGEQGGFLRVDQVDEMMPNHECVIREAS